MITNDEHRLFYQFINMKHPVFQGIESGNSFYFLKDCYKHLHKMGVVEKYWVAFVFFNYKMKQRNGKGHL